MAASEGELMPRVSPALTAFNAGEFGPLLEGRVDIARYANACRTLENFIPTVQGPVTRRAGSRFVHEVKTSANRTWLIPFEYNIFQNYVLEFGNQYIRFYYNHGILLSGAVLYEIVSPYTTADLTASDGTCQLKFVQDGDALYIIHPSHYPKKLVRAGHTSWTIADVDFAWGPFEDENITTTTVYASAETGTGVTVTASASIFTAAHVNTYFYIKQKSVSVVPMWEPGKSITAGDRRRSDGKTYEALNTATTGAIKPVHSEGAEYDGNTGVLWEYRDAGYGYVKITAVGSATSATATVIERLPSGCVGSGNTTARWAFAAWDSTAGYPSSITFFRERLCLARGRDVWMSVTGDFENFNRRDKSGNIVADCSIVVTISSDQNNNITWLMPTTNGLLVGTAGSPFLLGEITTSEALSPNNIKSSKQSASGTKNLSPVPVGNSVFYATRTGRNLRDIAYKFEADGYLSADATVLSHNALQGGIVAMSYQEEPHSIIWCVRTDGQLIGFTVNYEQEVKGWHRHKLGGSGIVESVAVIPAPDGSRDEVWLIVRRTIDGATKRYVEYIEKEYQTGDDQEDCFYVDSGLTYDGVAVTTISGLDHIEGCTVSVLADGAGHPDCVVASGSIALQKAASVVQVGLAAPCVIETMRIEGGSAEGTSQGKTKRCNKVVLRLDNTLGGSAGPTMGKLTKINWRMGSDLLGAPPSIFTGDKLIEWDGNYETDNRAIYYNDEPFPVTLVAIYPQFTAQDR